MLIGGVSLKVCNIAFMSPLSYSGTPSFSSTLFAYFDERFIMDSSEPFPITFQEAFGAITERLNGALILG